MSNWKNNADYAKKVQTNKEKSATTRKVIKIKQFDLLFTALPGRVVVHPS